MHRDKIYYYPNKIELIRSLPFHNILTRIKIVFIITIFSLQILVFAAKKAKCSFYTFSNFSAKKRCQIQSVGNSSLFDDMVDTH